MDKNLFHPVRIKDTVIPGNVFLAPLAGFTDPAFRTVCLIHGASLTFTEMVSAEALARHSEKTFKLMKRAGKEDLLGVQVFLSKAETLKRAFGEILRADPSVIDINCGCPVPKVIKTGAGSSLMKTPSEVKRIVAAAVSETDIPVTVKIRSGWDNNSVNFLEVADAALQGGASLISMHPRTRTEGFSGEPHLEHLTALKKFVSVPVIGSGNLFSPEDARTMLEKTGIDGVMFARGALGNPFIFEETIKLLQTGEKLPLPRREDRFSTALMQLRLCARDKGESAACKEMRKHMGSYIKGIPGAAALRRAIVQASTIDEYEDIFSSYGQDSR